MNTVEFDFLRKFLRDRSGLVLSDDKQYLIESRLVPVARRNGLASISEIVAKLRTQAPALEAAVVEAMTTNESFFFRDKTPFEHLRDEMMPALLAARAGQKKLRIWCAAASTGQEPYTIAMILADMAAKIAGWRIEILGTDLSTEVLDRAKAGLYTQFEIQRGLPIQLLMKHFTQKGDQWEISPAIRSMVQYRPLNLLRDFSSLGQFDIVFCRNVLIYFDQDTKIDVLSRICRMLAPDGYLTLGAAETVIGLTAAFKPHAERRGLYVLNRDQRPQSRLAALPGAGFARMR
jgi:chemotaxis protein methyltransferase CheR